MLLADLPLAHSRQTRVQDRGENGLADVVPIPQRPNLALGVGRHGLQAQRIEFKHPALVDEPRLVEITGALVHCFRYAALRLALSHGKPPAGLRSRSSCPGSSRSASIAPFHTPASHAAPCQ